MRPVLIISPEGGLCNRLRAIASARAVHELLGVPLKCAWRASRNEINAEFCDLFEPISSMEVIPYLNDYNYLRHEYSNYCFKRLAARASNRLLRFDSYVHADSRHLRQAAIHVKALIQRFGNKRVFIRSWQKFHCFRREHANVSLAHDLRQKVDQISSLFNTTTVGIHIRRTDHVVSQQNTPLDFFKNAIHSNLLRSEGVKFFLATDDRTVEADFKSEFGYSNFITFPKVFSRECREGVQDALIDLICLSKTSMIYGSYGSSFSSMASFIGGIPLYLPSGITSSEN